MLLLLFITGVIAQDFVYNLTVVTAYYKLDSVGGSNIRMTGDRYQSYFTNILNRLNCRIVVYTTPDNVGWITSKYLEKINRSVKVKKDQQVELDHNSTMVIITTYKSVYQFSPIIPYIEDYKTWQQDINPERKSRSYECSMLYISKVWMVKNVIDLNIYSDTDIYYWVDFGGMRITDNIGIWPLNHKVNHLFSDLDSKKIIVTTVSRNIKIKDYLENGDAIFSHNVSRDFIIGTFFGGKSQAINWYYQEFYKLVDLWIKGGKFAGKEQDLMNGLAFRFPDKFLILDLEGKYRNWRHQYYNHYWTYLGSETNHQLKYKPLLKLEYELNQ